MPDRVRIAGPLGRELVVSRKAFDVVYRPKGYRLLSTVEEGGGHRSPPSPPPAGGFDQIITREGAGMEPVPKPKPKPRAKRAPAGGSA